MFESGLTFSFTVYIYNLDFYLDVFVANHLYLQLYNLCIIHT